VRKKASITVFAALSLMLVAQLLFTLLEAARHYELQKVLYMNTDTVLEYELGTYSLPEKYIRGGKHAITMAKSDLSGNYINLQVNYYI
jgi:hypothetical protein